MHTNPQVVGVHFDAIEHFIDEHAPFVLGCKLPQVSDVDVSQVRSDALELRLDRFRPLTLFSTDCVRRFDRHDLSAQPALFLSEQLGADLAVVVEPQQLAPFRTKPVQRFRRSRHRGTPASGRRLGGRRLLSNSRSKLFIVTDQPQPEHRRPQQPTARTTGERAPFAPMTAPIVQMSRAIVLARHCSPALPAAHTSRQQVTTTTAARSTPTMRRSELFGRDDRWMPARVPLTTQQHFTEIDP
ncbi:MAG TPA: hypothetical protein VGO03_16430 [Acidimicrobiia bacterium]